MMSPKRTGPRGGALLLALPALPVLVSALVLVDARARVAAREASRPAISAVSQRLPAGSLALSGGARWLRSPATEEPGAAFADAPATLDADPAGGLLLPPRAIWAEQEARVSGGGR